jgi:hypothetical protein
MKNIQDIEDLMKELEVEKITLKIAIQNDVPFEEAKPIRQRISELEKRIATVQMETNLRDAEIREWPHELL